MKVQIKEFSQSLENIFSNLNPLMQEFSKSQAGNENLFEKVTKAAFVKLYEFNCTVIKSDDENIFFMMPVLRGICEDYIALKFISDELDADKDRVVELKFNEDLYKSARVQWEFFKKNHPDQILFYQKDFPDQEGDYTNELRRLMIANGIGLSSKNASLPTAYEMAKRAEILELYKYLYHATSSLVHFNPGILVRMGWGKIPEITFSVKNFNNYYKDFACFYGTYLYIEFGKWILSINLIDKSIERALQQISDLLKARDRWPELVTFEEMNIGPLSKTLFYKSPSRDSGK